MTRVTSHLLRWSGLTVALLGCANSGPTDSGHGLTFATLTGTAVDGAAAPVAGVRVTIDAGAPTPEGDCPGPALSQGVIVQKSESDSLGRFGGQLAIAADSGVQCLSITLKPPHDPATVVDTLALHFGRVDAPGSTAITVRVK